MDACSLVVLPLQLLRFTIDFLGTLQGAVQQSVLACYMRVWEAPELDAGCWQSKGAAACGGGHAPLAASCCRLCERERSGSSAWHK